MLPGRRARTPRTPRLVGERLDPGVGHRPDAGMPQPARGLDVAGPGEAGDVRRARRQQAGVRPVPAPGAELEERPAAGRGDHPRRLDATRVGIGERGHQVASRPTAPAATGP